MHGGIRRRTFIREGEGKGGGGEEENKAELQVIYYKCFKGNLM